MPSLRDEIKDAVTPRTFGLVFGVLLLQLGFILSYIGAFHAPTPQHVRVGLVAPAAQADGLAQRLNALDGSPLSARVVPSAAQARAEVADSTLSAALVLDPTGTTDQLLTATGGGASVATAVQQVLGQVEAAQHRTLTVTDVVPLQSGDGRGLSGFYLVIGWMVGGYLVASLLGVARGSRPPTVRRAVLRLVTLIPYAVVSGLGGAVIAGPVLGALDGHLLSLWWLGALIVYAAAAATTAFQVLFGVLGVGLAVLVFVVLGNPSAGGAYQLDLLPPFWRAIGNAIPNGAGTDTVRRIVYFDGHGITGHLLVIAGWALAGTVVAVLGAHLFHERAAREDEPTSAPHRPRPQPGPVAA